MIIYKDIITDDEIVSDAYDLKVVDDVFFEVDCKMITQTVGDIDIGANASTEEAEESVEDGATQVNNVVFSFRLHSTSFDKKSWTSYIKGYMKAVKANLEKTDPARVEEFTKGAQSAVKKILGNFKNYEFYVGESMNPDGMVLLLNYREDGFTPYFTIWKDGLSEMKV